MTTKVTVNAHAGWPVLVVIKRGEPTWQQTVEYVNVLPFTQQDFYIHSGAQIMYIGEQPRQ